MLGPGSVLNMSSALQTENRSFSLVPPDLDGEPWESRQGQEEVERKNQSRKEAVLLFPLSQYMGDL